MSLCVPAPRMRIGAEFFAADRFGSSFFSPVCFTSRRVSNPARRKCAIQSALPGAAEALYSGLGGNVNETIIEFHNSILQGANQLGLSLPLQDSKLWWWAVVAPVVLSYLFATPGSVAGLVDFVYAPMHSQSFRSFSAEDVEIGRQLGEGSFGVVYEGFFGRGRKGAKSGGLHVVLKKAKTRVRGASEIHNSEIHMNYRLQRTASVACAEFLGTMQVKSTHAHGKLSEGLWLVWNFQGDRSLDYYLKQKNFPENLGDTVLGEVLSKQDAFRRSTATIKTVFRQILTNLQDLHRSGVVHRDVKPLNLILDQDSGTFKFIDFGACVDLRSGFNYVPNETVIDPTYAAPEHYVMPTSTPNLPPDPVCSLVSPLLWHLNTPDRFDLYSAGLILMQLSMKSLRHETGLQAFNAELKRSNYDLKLWRARCRHSKEEFAVLDADGGAGWELATALLQPRHDKDHLIWPSLGNSRPSASAALRHRFLKGSVVKPKQSPTELQPSPALAPTVLLAFEGVTHKFSSAAKTLFDPSRVNWNVPALEGLEDKKAKLKVPSYQSSSKSAKPKELEKARPAGFPLFNPASLPTAQILSSSSVVTEKLSHAFQDTFNGRPAAAGGKKVDEAATDIGKTGGTVKRPQPIQNNGKLLTDNQEKNVDAVTMLQTTRKVEASVDEQDKSLTQHDVKRTGTMRRSIGAALPAAASTAMTLATGWLVFLGLNSSAQASYELGKLLMSSSGVSGSAFLAFFLVIKPWIEERSALLSQNERREEWRTEDFAEIESQENLLQLDKYRSVHEEPVKVQVVVEAVQELEMQMSSLEALMRQEQQVSQQHKELVQKMESLLLHPSIPQSTEMEFAEVEHSRV